MSSFGDHRMVLAELRGEGPQRNCAYRMWRQGYLIEPRTIRPLTEGEVAFAALKGEVDRTKRPTKVRESYISLETWRLVDRHTALQRLGRARSKEV